MSAQTSDQPETRDQSEAHTLDPDTAFGQAARGTNSQTLAASMHAAYTRASGPGLGNNLPDASYTPSDRPATAIAYWLTVNGVDIPGPSRRADVLELLDAAWRYDDAITDARRRGAPIDTLDEPATPGGVTGIVHDMPHTLAASRHPARQARPARIPNRPAGLRADPPRRP
jgi:hypothetical protein